MSIEFMKGIALGIEILEDDDDMFLCIEILFIRFMIEI